MTGRTDIERRLDRFLADGPETVADRAIQHALDEIDRTAQRRVLVAPWRFPQMNIYARLGAAAIVAVIAIGGALYLIGPRNGPGGQGPSPIPSASPTSTPTASAAATPDTTSWTPFSSAVFGYDARYPAGWRLEPGTMPARLGDLTGAKRTVFDHFVMPPENTTELYGTSTLVPNGMSEDAWIAAYRDPVVAQFGAACFPPRDQWESVTVDGRAGGLYVGCNYVESTTFVSGRAYIFTFALPLGVPPGSAAKTMLEALLSTVILHPERAVAPSPGAS